MNKYQIDQTVYFITVLAGRIKVEPMRIDKVEIDRKKKLIYYSGVCEKDPEAIPHSEYEDRLYPSRIDGLQEIERQLAELRVHDEPC